jgi:hypothetical protein
MAGRFLSYKMIAAIFWGAPDGWDSARFLELVLNFGSFPFRELFLPSRR